MENQISTWLSQEARVRIGLRSSRHFYLASIDVSSNVSGFDENRSAGDVSRKIAQPLVHRRLDRDLDDCTLLLESDVNEIEALSADVLCRDLRHASKPIVRMSHP